MYTGLCTVVPGSPDYRAPTSAFIFSTSSAEFSFSCFSSSTVLASSFSKLSIICNNTQYFHSAGQLLLKAVDHLQQHTVLPQCWPAPSQSCRSSATTHSTFTVLASSFSKLSIICNNTQYFHSAGQLLLKAVDHLQQHTVLSQCWPAPSQSCRSSATTHSTSTVLASSFSKLSIICNNTQYFHSAGQLLLKAVNHLTQSMPHDLPKQPLFLANSQE